MITHSDSDADDAQGGDDYQNQDLTNAQKHIKLEVCEPLGGPEVDALWDDRGLTFKMMSTTLPGTVVDAINEDGNCIELIDAYVGDDGAMRCTLAYDYGPAR